MNILPINNAIQQNQPSFKGKLDIFTDGFDKFMGSLNQSQRNIVKSSLNSKEVKEIIRNQKIVSDNHPIFRIEAKNRFGMRKFFFHC